MDYSREFGSQYPSELIMLNTHKDVDDSVASLINEYNSYVESGNTKSAYELYETNKETLKPYILNMEYINYLEEEIYNIGLMALLTNVVVHSNNEPITSENDTYWIQEYE